MGFPLIITKSYRTCLPSLLTLSILNTVSPHCLLDHCWPSSTGKAHSFSFLFHHLNIKLVPQAGLAPATHGSSNRRSTLELLRHGYLNRSFGFCQPESWPRPSVTLRLAYLFRESPSYLLADGKLEGVQGFLRSPIFAPCYEPLSLGELAHPHKLET